MRGLPKIVIKKVKPYGELVTWETPGTVFVYHISPFVLFPNETTTIETGLDVQFNKHEISVNFQRIAENTEGLQLLNIKRGDNREVILSIRNVHHLPFVWTEDDIEKPFFRMVLDNGDLRYNFDELFFEEEYNEFLLEFIDADHDIRINMYQNRQVIKN